MKFLSRDFTQKERILLIVLAVLLLVVFYYYVVDIPLRDQQAELESRKSSVESELTIANAKVAEYDKMAKDLKKMNGDASKMESY
ncbi:MAG: type II secretion system protein M, partial [Lachnospiraceae bacterium]|nr:type II secretion system protein M [Lachnospiraceae bacterium]